MSSSFIGGGIGGGVEGVVRGVTMGEEEEGRVSALSSFARGKLEWSEGVEGASLVGRGL